MEKSKFGKIRTGKCIRRFESAHSAAVTSLSFIHDGSQILSSSFDHTLRIHGLKSGKTIKILRGHNGSVNDGIFCSDGSTVISASSDGTLKLWDVKTSDCIQTFNPPKLNSFTEQSIHSLAMMPGNSEQIFVCNRTSSIFLMNIRGEVIRKFSSNQPFGGEFVCCCVSPKGEYLYAVTDDGTLYSFNTQGKMEHTMKAHDKEVLAISHHPYLNLLATASTDGSLKLWKP